MQTQGIFYLLVGKEERLRRGRIAALCQSCAAQDESHHQGEEIRLRFQVIHAIKQIDEARCVISIIFEILKNEWGVCNP